MMRSRLFARFGSLGIHGTAYLHLLDRLRKCTPHVKLQGLSNQSLLLHNAVRHARRYKSVQSGYATVACHYFPTKQALSDKLKLFVQDETTILDPRNQEIALEAVSVYDKVYSKGKPIRVFVKRNTAKFNNLAMHVEMESGEVVTVAYGKVAIAVGDPEKAANRRRYEAKLESLREAVLPDINKFKDKFQLDKCFCEECGKKLSTRSDCQVDHHGRYEFRHIVEMYQKKHAGGDLYAIDPHKFASYHRKKAELRLVCVHCNQTKAKGW